MMLLLSETRRIPIYLRDIIMAEPDQDLSIKTLIRAVTQELLASREERQAAGEPAVFQVDELTLEISFVATNSNQGGGGFQFWVIKADAGVKYDEQSVQKIILKLKPAMTSDDEPFGLEEPFKPSKLLF
jgi:hypothetical protein